MGGETLKELFKMLSHQRNASQSCFAISSFPSQNGQDQMTARAIEDVCGGKGNTYSLLMGVPTGVTTMKINMEVP